MAESSGVTPVTAEPPETFEAMQERGARRVASLRREADRVEAFMTDLRGKVDKHEHAQVSA
jgi:hypothetical protein